jgi:Sulfotransferase family
MTAPTPLLNGIRPPGNSFVLPEHKIVYMSVTKVACTSLRWMIADISGEDLDSFYPAIGAHQSRLMTIHRNRTHWEKTPQLFTLTDQQRAEISRDNGWFIFAVVRDPWSRLWSGWQSKFLVRHQFYVDQYAEEPWFPRVPTKPEDVIEDFAKFTAARPWETHPLLSTDVHFLPQVHSVRPQGINYTRIYDLSDLSTLFRDLHAHLASQGKDQELYLPRANETPLPLIPAVLEGGVAEAIERAYAPDFEAFGDRWSLDTVKMDQELWSSDAIRHAAYHTVANQRIGDMRNEAWRLRRELHQAQKRIAVLERRTRRDPPSRTTASLPARVKDRLPPRLRARLGRVKRRLLP